MKAKHFLLICISTFIFLFSSCEKETTTPAPIPVTTDIDLSPSQLDSTNLVVSSVTYAGSAATKIVFQSAYETQLLQDLIAGNNVTPRGLATTNIDMQNGIIEFDMALEINPAMANQFSRGFGGIAYRLQDNDDYEAVYFRGTNGSLNNPRPSSLQVTHAVQYISAPAHEFQDLRTNFPDVYEKSANISIDTWHHYKYVIGDDITKIYVDNEPTPTITVDNQFAINKSGKIALWVSMATNAYFKNMKVTK